MMWIKNLFGLASPLEKKKKKLANIRKEAMMAQRNGDLRKYAVLINLAESIEDSIIEMSNDA